MDQPHSRVVQFIYHDEITSRKEYQMVSPFPFSILQLVVRDGTYPLRHNSYGNMEKYKRNRISVHLFTGNCIIFLTDTVLILNMINVKYQTAVEGSPLFQRPNFLY